MADETSSFFYLIKDDEVDGMYKMAVGTASYSSSIAEGIHSQLPRNYEYEPGGRIIRSDDPRFSQLMNKEKKDLTDTIRRLKGELLTAENRLSKVKVVLGEVVPA